MRKTFGKIEEILYSHEVTMKKCGTKQYEMEWFTPAGEDYVFYIDAGTVTEFADRFNEEYEEFDADEHASLWISGRGTNGIPSSIAVLVHDAACIEQMLQAVAEDVYDYVHERKTIAEILGLEKENAPAEKHRYIVALALRVSTNDGEETDFGLYEVTSPYVMSKSELECLFAKVNYICDTAPEDFSEDVPSGEYSEKAEDIAGSYLAEGSNIDTLVSKTAIYGSLEIEKCTDSPKAVSIEGAFTITV